jgi:hypothetical protein
MQNKLDKSEILQIFGLILAIGKSEHYSISIDYDTEFDSIDAYLWYSETQKDIIFDDKLNDKQYTYAEIIEKLKSWTEIIVKDRGEFNDNPH